MEVYKTSSSEAVLKLVNLERGDYVFNLTVTDGHAKSSSTRVTVAVFEDEMTKNLVEITVPTCPMVTQNQKDLVKEEFELDLKRLGVTEVQDSVNFKIMMVVPITKF